VWVVTKHLAIIVCRDKASVQTLSFLITASLSYAEMENSYRRSRWCFAYCMLAPGHCHHAIVTWSGNPAVSASFTAKRGQRPLELSRHTNVSAHNTGGA